MNYVVITTREYREFKNGLPAFRQLKTGEIQCQSKDEAHMLSSAINRSVNSHGMSADVFVKVYTVKGTALLSEGQIADLLDAYTMSSISNELKEAE